MATETKTPFHDLMQQARDMLAENPMIPPQMEQFWVMQDGLLEEAERYSRSWFERRHAATQTALDALRDTYGNGANPVATFQAVADWQQHSLERMVEDAQQMVDLWTRCASHVASAEVTASNRLVEKAEARAKPGDTKKATKAATAVTD